MAVAVGALVVVVLLVAAGVVSYNRFVAQRTTLQESWRQVDVELTRRHDLIPNLVQTVQGYAAHESQVLAAVTGARATAMTGGITPAAQGRQESALTTALGQLFAVAEAYPTLKASDQFLALQHQLTDTEDRIAAARRFYNNNVRSYNVRLGQFPSSFIAGFGHFPPAEFFQADAGSEESSVSFVG